MYDPNNVEINTRAPEDNDMEDKYFDDNDDNRDENTRASDDDDEKDESTADDDDSDESEDCLMTPFDIY